MNNLERRKRNGSPPQYPVDRPLNGNGYGGNGYAYSNGAAHDPEQTAIDFRDIIDTLRRGKWIILVTCMLISAGIAGFKLTETPLYEATSLVRLSTNQNKQLSPSDRLSDYSVKELSQADELSFLNNSGELGRRVASRLEEVSRVLGSDSYFTILRSEEGGMPLETEQISARLRQKVQFVPAEQSMIAIKAVSSSKVEAIQVANLYAEEYKNFDLDRSRAQLTQALDFLESELARRREALTSLDFQWEAMMKESGFVSGSSTETAQLNQQFGTFQTRLENVRIQLQTERQQRDHLQGEFERVAPNLVTSVSSGLDKEIEALQERIAGMKMEVQEYYLHDPSTRGREQDVPELQRLIGDIASLESRRDDLSQQLVSQTLNAGAGSPSGGEIEPLGYATQLKARILEKDIKINELTLSENILAEKVAELERKRDAIPSRSLELEQLERERAVEAQWYNTLSQELQKTEIAQQSEIGNVTIVQEAQNSMPVGNNLAQSLVLGLVLGLGFGAGLAFIRKAIDQRILRPNDVRDLGYNLVGVIPEMRREIKQLYGGKELVEHNGAMWNTRLVSVLQPSSSIAENYRLTRTNIDFLDRNHPPQVILVTSPESGDGKSVTAVNLAVTMAESGRQTLLIDLDLRRPTAHKLLGIERVPGFVDLLTNPGEFLLEQFQSSVRDLHVIPAGSTPQRPSELIGSSLLRDGIYSLRELFDTIIIDSPPVLAVTDAVVLSTVSDATIVVVSADATDQQALNITRQTLEAVGVQVSGIILNKFDARRAGMKGTHFYGYDSAYEYTPSLNGTTSLNA